MPTKIVLPKLDRIMTEGVIEEWLKKRGEAVAKDDAIAVIETVKASIELNAPESGIFLPMVGKGETVPVGSVIAMVLAPGEELPQELPTKASTATTITATTIPAAVPQPTVKAEPGEGLHLATPSARRVARELGVDLGDVQGTGPNGRIVAEDVISLTNRRKSSQTAPLVGSETGTVKEQIPLKGWRKVMAERMAESVRTAAQITTVAEVDATELVNLRGRLGAADRYKGTHLTFTAFVVTAIAEALVQHRMLNTSLLDDRVVVHDQVNIGVAVAIETGGLVVPVIHNADKKDLATIARELEELSTKAREKKLSLEEVSGGTFTVTNPGMLGVIFDTPLIVVPESGILGIGAIVKRPCVINGEIVIRDVMYLSLTYDHRIIEGHVAIGFLQRVRQLIEHPNDIAEEESSSTQHAPHSIG